MKASAPKHATWLIGLILGILGIVGYFVPVPVITPYAFFLTAAGFIVLALGTSLKDL